MIARAVQKNVRVSAKKASLCCRLIRNKPVDVALKILEHQNQKTAQFLYKLLISASANAVNNHAMQGSKLYVFTSVANQGPTLKRTLPRAKGRADLMKKRTSNLEIWVSDDVNDRKNRDSILLKPRAHQSKYRKLSDEKSSIEIMPKLIVKKQREADGSEG